MSYREHALRLAERGFYVFPAQLSENPKYNKRPVYGFMAWEENATTDFNLLNQWWDQFPDAVTAVAPGRSGLAVIDVDRHEGSADGFASLQQHGIQIDEDVTRGTSLSGNGTHLWYSADITSLNGVIPGVDRKAKGGYVIVPYLLPYAYDIRTPLPERLTRGRESASIHRRNMDAKALNDWLQTVGSGPISEPMYEVIDSFQGRGNSQMSAAIAKVVSRAARGHSGASKALDRLMTVWVEAPHSSGDPEEEFRVNMKSAIEKFGAPIEDDDDVKELQGLLSDERPFEVNHAALSNSLVVYVDSLRPSWREDSDVDSIRAVLKRCLDLVPRVQTVEDVDKWREGTKKIMKETLEKVEN